MVINSTFFSVEFRIWNDSNGKIVPAIKIPALQTCYSPKKN